MENNTKIESVSLHLLQENTGQLEGIPANPRLIKNQQFEDLKKSILNFPQMLQLRPITYAGDYIVLGGNQRRAALLDINKMSLKQITAKLEKSEDFASKTEEQQQEISAFWEAFVNDADKVIPAQDASHLSTAQMMEFVIKDNVQFGENDYDILANEWDLERIKDWGMQIPENWGADEDEEKNPFADEGITAQNQYGVIIMCKGEDDQQKVFEKMSGEGYTCKVVVT